MSISVAMCTFNGRRFLPAQLDSIAAQDRPPDELVVVDDNSLDGSNELLEEFARRAPFPVRLFRNETSLGSTKNFEKAISLCQGSIVALADQDDVWYRHKLERVEREFLRSKNVVAVFSDADVIDEDCRSLGVGLWLSFTFTPSEQRRFADGQALDVLVRRQVVTGATMSFRRECYDLLIPVPARDVHDSWMSFLLAAFGELRPIPEALMQYRRHSGQQHGPGILRPLNLHERLMLARRRLPCFYLTEIERLGRLADRLKERRSEFPHADRALNEISRKIRHYQHRASLPRTNALRVPNILREILNSGYWRYSNGWVSVAGDLVIR